MAMITRNLNFKRDLFNEQKANVRGISTGVVYVELLDAHSSLVIIPRVIFQT